MDQDGDEEGGVEVQESEGEGELGAVVGPSARGERRERRGRLNQRARRASLAQMMDGVCGCDGDGDSDGG